MDKTVVLTGASGVVGTALLPHLEDYRLVCMVNRSTMPDRYETLTSDVSEARLGLGQTEYRELARRADLIVHAAALTDWPQPKEQFDRINVGGTKNVLEFAALADAPIHHISTAFIQALPGRSERPVLDANVITNYVRSKMECEQLVAASGITHSTVRPTNISGDSQSGQITRKQTVQLVSDLILRGKLPLIPGRPETPVDVIPQDFVAKAVAGMVKAEDLGSEYWLTAGEESITLGDACEICVQFSDEIGRPIARPRFVSEQELEARGLEEVTDELSPLAKKMFERMIEFHDGMVACGTFPSSLAEVRIRYGVPELSFAETYRRGLEYSTGGKSVSKSVAVETAGSST